MVALVEMQIGKIFRVVTSTHPAIIMYENNHIQPVCESSAKRHTSHGDVKNLLRANICLNIDHSTKSSLCQVQSMDNITPSRRTVTSSPLTTVSTL